MEFVVQALPTCFDAHLQWNGKEPPICVYPLRVLKRVPMPIHYLMKDTPLPFLDKIAQLRTQIDPFLMDHEINHICRPIFPNNPSSPDVHWQWESGEITEPWLLRFLVLYVTNTQLLTVRCRYLNIGFYHDDEKTTDPLLFDATVFWTRLLL